MNGQGLKKLGRVFLVPRVEHYFRVILGPGTITRRLFPLFSLKKSQIWQKRCHLILEAKKEEKKKSCPVLSSNAQSERAISDEVWREVERREKLT